MQYILTIAKDGSITLSKEMMEEYDIEPGDTVTFELAKDYVIMNGKIVIQKYTE